MPNTATRQKRSVSWYLRAATGPDFLDIKSLILLAAPVSLSTSLFSWESGSPFEIWARVIGNLFGFASVAVLIALYKLFPRRAENFLIAGTSVLLVSAVLGFAKAVTTNAVAALVLNQELETGLWARGFLGAVAGSVLLPVTAIISATLREYGEERELLLLAAYNNKVDSLTSKKELANLRQIRLEVDRMRQLLKSSGREAIPSAEIALLRELVEKRVRPLSHSLYANLEKTYPSFELFSLLRSALRKPPPGIWIALLHMVAIPQTITLIGWQLGLMHATFTMLCLGLFFTLGFQITQKLRILNPTTFVVQASLSGYLSVTIANFLTRSQVMAETTLDVAAALWYLNTAVLFAGASYARGLADKNRADLLKLRAEGEAQPISLEKSRRDFANQLHGEVQSRILTLLLKAESDPGLKKDIALRELETVAELLGRKLTSEPADLMGGLERLRKQWVGILDLEVNIPKTAALTDLSDKILPVLEQAVLNASRHGLADKVAIQISEAGDCISLLIEDNGIGPVGGNPGLGSKLFSSVSKNWSLGPGPNGGSILKLEL